MFYVCVCFLIFVFFVWDLLLLYMRVKFDTAHCQPVISVTRNKSDKNEFIPEHKLNVNAFGKTVTKRPSPEYFAPIVTNLCL